MLESYPCLRSLKLWIFLGFVAACSMMMAAWDFFPHISKEVAFVSSNHFGASMGDFITKGQEQGGLDLGDTIR